MATNADLLKIFNRLVDAAANNSGSGARRCCAILGTLLSGGLDVNQLESLEIDWKSMSANEEVFPVIRLKMKGHTEGKEITINGNIENDSRP